MSRRSFASTMRAIGREAARAERARQQAHVRLEAAQRRAATEATRQAKSDAKEAARQYQTARAGEAEALSKETQEREQAIETLLTRALAETPRINLYSLLKTFEPKQFDHRQWATSAPKEEDYAVQVLGFFRQLVPGAKHRHGKRVAEARNRYETAERAYQAEQVDKAAAFAIFAREEAERKTEIENSNLAVQELQRGLNAGEHDAVVAYFRLVMERNLVGEPDAISAEVGYAPESKHLVVELDLPEPSAIPEESGFKYVKTSDRIDPILRPDAKRKALYQHLICAVALKTIDTVFRAAPEGVIDCLTLNGMLDTINPASGQDERVCLLTVRLTVDTFRTLNLAQVQPEQCLRSLKASVSRAPGELAPVKPIMQLEMVDPRFIDTMDVMSGLAQRPNLMDLNPTEFEGLITNLFAKMGLETRQTQASRDGGVDCVAFDQRAIFGGKVVIQAKRYKNTVGVSAVRDLYGTVMNEGASKGILVTTSGFGKAAWQFASDKPLELLDGGNLLHLLAEHAEMEARIVMPETWVDISGG